MLLVIRSHARRREQPATGADAERSTAGVVYNLPGMKLAVGEEPDIKMVGDRQLQMDVYAPRKRRRNTGVSNHLRSGDARGRFQILRLGSRLSYEK